MMQPDPIKRAARLLEEEAAHREAEAEELLGTAQFRNNANMAFQERQAAKVHQARAETLRSHARKMLAEDADDGR